MGWNSVHGRGLCRSEMVEMSRTESLQDIHPNKREVFACQSYQELFHHKPSVCNEN